VALGWVCYGVGLGIWFGIVLGEMCCWRKKKNEDFEFDFVLVRNRVLLQAFT
jgi:hypothetical protein